MNDPTDVAALVRRLETVERELSRLKDVQAVRTLQFQYGYYMDKGLYDEVVDLFAAEGELYFMGGIFRGRAGLRRLYCGRLRETFTGGHNGRSSACFATTCNSRTSSPSRPTDCRPADAFARCSRAGVTRPSRTSVRACRSSGGGGSL